ncbi:hypothetical protein E1171_11275 [Cytophagales bacterium RKSG123]|nr:hypothetical protein [Xanthovirga aplysinae]
MVEIVILCSFFAGILPKAATFEGYNFDIIMGITAPIMGVFAQKNGSQSYKWILAWNILGLVTLAIVVFIVISASYFPEVWGSKEPLVSTQFTHFPITLLPGFIMPSAVFMHVLSIMILRKKIK